MGAYSTTSARESSERTTGADGAADSEAVRVALDSESDEATHESSADVAIRDEHADTEGKSIEGSPALERHAQAAQPVPPLWLAARIVAWLFFAGGVVGAVLGIAGLRVEITVAGLILACTAGLILLKLRAGAPVPAKPEAPEST